MLTLLAALVGLVAAEPAAAQVRIVSPTGQPTANAELIVLVASDSKFPYVQLRNGFPDSRGFIGQRPPQRYRSDPDGRVSIMVPEEPFALYLNHTDGVALVTEFDPARTDAVVLEPWGRIEGEILVGSEPYANRLAYVSMHRGDPSVLSINYTLTVETDSQGRFSFEEVPPGRGIIGRWFFRESGNHRSEGTETSTSLEVKAGALTSIKLGGLGCAVRGKLLPPPSHQNQVEWNQVRGTIRVAERRRLPDPVPVLDGIEQPVEESEDGRQPPAERHLPETLRFFLENDGTFKVDDVPVGFHSLSIQTRATQTADVVLSAEHSFEVSHRACSRPGGTIDLGTIPLRENKADSMRQAEPEPMAIDTELVEVSAFRRQVYFYAKDKFLWMMDSKSECGLQRVFTIHNDNTQLMSRIGVFENGEVLVSDGQSLWRVAQTGESQVVTSLSELRSINSQIPEDARVNWFLAPSADERFLYAVLLSAEQGENHIVRFDTGTKGARFLEVAFPWGIDIDTHRGVAYVPRFDVIEQRSYVDTLDFERAFSSFLDWRDKKSAFNSYPVTHRYTFAALSPQRNKLLLSMGGVLAESFLAVFDVESGTESVLPVNGTHASWANDSELFIVRGERELWHYEIGEATAKRLISVDGAKAHDQGSYAKSAVVSDDGTWLAWQWAGRDQHGQLGMGTILVDLVNGEYRRLDGGWNNVAWGH